MPKGVKGFQKGHKFGVRRKKGVKNKNKQSDQWNYFAKFCIEGGLIRFKKELEKLKGKQYVDAFLTLLEYHKPKLQRSELIGADKMKLQVEWVIPNKQELQEQKKLNENVRPQLELNEMAGVPADKNIEESPPQAIPSKEPALMPTPFTVPPGKDDTEEEDDNVPPIGVNI